MRDKNEINVFIFKGNDVRTIEKDGEPLFIAKDICRILEVKNSRDALKHLDEDEKGVVSSDTPWWKTANFRCK